jgi:hypothetical protein
MAAYCFLLANDVPRAAELIEKSLAIDQSREKSLRLAGCIYGTLARNRADIQTAKKSLQMFVEAKDLKDDSRNARNCCLTRKLIYLLNQKTLQSKKKALLEYLTRNAFDVEQIGTLLNNFDFKSIDSIPKTFQCPLTLVA